MPREANKFRYGMSAAGGRYGGRRRAQATEWKWNGISNAPRARWWNTTTISWIISQTPTTYANCIIIPGLHHVNPPETNPSPLPDSATMLSMHARRRVFPDYLRSITGRKTGLSADSPPLHHVRNSAVCVCACFLDNRCLHQVV